MKIGYVIHEKYKEVQVMICADQMSLEVKSIGETISKVLTESITVHGEKGIEKISTDSIIRVFSQDGKVFVQTGQKTYQVHLRMYEAEETFGNQFIRISNSEMVNKHRIDHLDTTFAGTIMIYLQGDITSFVSRRYVSKIKKALEL